VAEPSGAPRAARGTGRAAVLGLVVALGLAAGLAWWAVGPRPAPDGPVREPGGDDALAALMARLEIVPLAARPPAPFALPTLDGGRLALAELTGRAALLYFWATW